MKKILIFLVASIIAFTGYLLISPTYARIKSLHSNRISIALSIRNLLTKYYRLNLKFPTDKDEFDHFIHGNSDGSLEEIERIDYRIKIVNDSIYFYDLGFDNDNDNLSKLINDGINPLVFLFGNGDYLIAAFKFSNPVKLLVDNYFVYGNDLKLLVNQKQFRQNINLSRQSFLRNYYMSKFNLDLRDVRIRPGENFDTLLVSVNCRSKLLNYELSNGTVEDEASETIFSSLCDNLMVQDSSVNLVFVSLPILWDVNKIMK